MKKRKAIFNFLEVETIKLLYDFWELMDYFKKKNLRVDTDNVGYLRLVIDFSLPREKVEESFLITKNDN